MLGFQLYEYGVCDCGFHKSLIDPETLVVTFEDRVCPVCAGAAAKGRIQAAVDEEAIKLLGQKPKPSVPRPGDGRVTVIRQVPPNPA